MRYMYNMMGWGGGYDSLSCGGGAMTVTTLLVWAVLILLAVLLWQKINNK